MPDALVDIMDPICAPAWLPGTTGNTLL